MFFEILNKNQVDLQYLLSKFKKEFYMVGGTAIALHIGHRLSIDFYLLKREILTQEKFYKNLRM